MLRNSTTKVIPKDASHSLLDAIAIAIEEMEEGHLILDVIVDYGENEALIVYAYDNNEEEDDE
jgi:hypothetical protein